MILNDHLIKIYVRVEDIQGMIKQLTDIENTDLSVEKYPFVRSSFVAPEIIDNETYKKVELMIPIPAYLKLMKWSPL